VVIAALEKKTQKTPKRLLELCRRRLMQYDQDQDQGEST